MSDSQNKKLLGLPDNAYSELAPGEEYHPVMSPEEEIPEINVWSVTWGLLMAVLFSGAAAYLGLKIGQVFEAAIPIAIIAVGVSAVAKRNKGMGENVIIQSIGSTSGAVVAGAIFTIPALYILELEVEFFQVFMASLLGGFLGILFLIPFRRYFVAEMHGKFPFPEATATTEVLVAGGQGSNQAKILVLAGLIGGIYDFVIATFGAWTEEISTRLLPIGEKIATEFKLLFKVNIGAAVMGLGYIIGLKYAAIIAAGSFFAWYVFMPMFAYLGDFITVPIGAGVTTLIKDMSAEQIFSSYIRHIGIGGIAMAGLLGIVKSSGIIKSAFVLGYNEIFGKKHVETNVARTNRDLSMKIIAMGIFVVSIVVFLFFLFGVVDNLFHALVGLAIVLIISFLFTTVAANAIAIVGTNPVSGMTLMTLILSSIVLVSVGLSGSAGMVSALIIGGVVCTALSVAGAFITDLKIGYWLGSSPYKQEKWKFVGTALSAATVAGVILILNSTYGFVGEDALVAPQANAMAAVLKPLMSNQPAPWMLYAGGALMALILNMIGVPALAFALGVYIPLQLNTPILIGGLIAYFVSTRSKDKEVNKARRERGTLIASGFIAGGALLGVVSALIKFIQNSNDLPDWKIVGWAGSHGAEVLGFVMFIALCAYMIWDSMRAKKQD